MTGNYIAVDTGGTFTDLVAFDPRTRRVRFTKSLTTHEDPIEGIADCLRKTQLPLGEAALFKHGTTLVINTLIERSGPRVALVTTMGFRDVLDLARGNRLDPFDLFYKRSAALVPRTSRLEIDERVAGNGEVLRRPQRADVERLAQQIRDLGVSAVAVSLLNAYREPANEQLVTQWLRTLLPDLFVTCATELSREWYEYERTSTAAANAYTGPKVSQYVGAMAQRLTEGGFQGQFLVMGSNGGMLSSRQASVAPVMLIESGPIGGCIGAGAYATALGLDHLIAFDMGGTTAKAALIQSGKFDVVGTYYVGGYGKGLPIRTPVIDIVEVGAGGGSIAWTDGQGLHVGPRSAGSMPGPVCYGRGGTQPTVTDANLVLGRLNAACFQGGEMALDASAARTAIETQLAAPLGYTGDANAMELAGGVVSIGVVTMSGAIKRITVECGKDPRDFVLFAYGGGGPLHAADIARELGMTKVIIPPQPGNFSALGMLMSDIRRDQSRTFLHRLDTQAPQAMATLYEEVETQLLAGLREDFGDIVTHVHRAAEIRYVGQFHTVRLPVDTGDAVQLREAFDKEYLARYGHNIPSGKAEIVSLHVSVLGALPHPDLASAFATEPGRAGKVRGSRAIWFPEGERLFEASVYAREELGQGFRAEGPAVIEEYGSTTIVGPRDSFEIGALGEIHIEVAPLVNTLQ